MSAIVLLLAASALPQAPSPPQAPERPLVTCGCQGCPCGCQKTGLCGCGAPDADGWRKTTSGPHRYWRYAPAAPAMMPAAPPALMYRQPSFAPAPAFGFGRGGGC